MTLRAVALDRCGDGLNASAEHRQSRQLRGADELGIEMLCLGVHEGEQMPVLGDRG
jgi:hypothetical protein